MKLTLRQARPDDAEACGRICHDAFEAIAARHGFPKDFPSREMAIGLMSAMIPMPSTYAVVAERDGRIVGSNILHEFQPVFGVGPISVDPDEQDHQAGRQLMQSALDRAAQQGVPGVRLVQDTFNTASLALYTKLGFRARLTAAVLQGPAIAPELPGISVRSAAEGDFDTCNQICEAIHGHTRAGELADAIGNGNARVSLRSGRITGYTTGIAMFSHSVAETNVDLEALIASAEAFGGPGFLVPTGNDALMRWCFDHGLRVVKAVTLMSIGLYNEPQGAFLPSILY